MRRGFTLIEVVVSAFLLLLLTGMLLSNWYKASRVFKQNDRHNERRTETQLVLRRLESELPSSSAESLEIRPDLAIAFASPLGLLGTPNAGQFQVQPEGEPIYEKYIILYWNGLDNTLYRREMAIPTGQPARFTPLRISSVNFGSGPKPLTDYLSRGRPVARNVVAFSPNANGYCLELTLDVALSQNISENFQSATILRN